MSLLVSCIVPVFNGERYLAEALQSIVAQSYRPIEIIAVDDGSTDSSAEVVSRFGEEVLYLHQPNSGPAAARNRGLDAARGQIVAFLDADDLWHPDKLTRQMARFDVRPQLDCCLTQIQNFWIPELQREAERLRNHRFGRPLAGYSTVTLAARRDVFDRVGRFEPTLRLGEDTDWFARAADCGMVFEVIPEVLVLRRRHRSNVTRQHLGEIPDAILGVVKRSLDRRRRRG